MGGEVGKVSSLPPLPAGECLFSNLPARAIVLEALAPALGDGIVTLIDGESTAVLVVRGGAIADAVTTVSGAQENGEAALALLRGWESASLSCIRLTGEAMSLLDPLLHGELLYSDLRLEWTSWSHLLDDLRRRGQTFVVEVQTPSDRGVTLIRGGEQVATYTDSHPSPGGPDLLDTLAAACEGSIRVLAVRVTPRLVESPPAPPEVHVAAATPATNGAPFSEGVTAVPHVGGDDADATLSALFGLPGPTRSFTPTATADRLDPPGAGDVGALLPELKRLVQRRLQRSSAPVDDAVDRAADENRSVDWLAARVRVMRVRGFVPETLEHLADEMQALVRTS